MYAFAAHFCICADGGANRLYDAAPSFAHHLSATEARELAKPAVIAGDLDSITVEVREFYQGLGTKIVDLSADQDTTDLQKCLIELEREFNVQELSEVSIIIAGQLFLPICDSYMLSNLSAACLWRMQVAPPAILAL